jgi:hypothetical protein
MATADDDPERRRNMWLALISVLLILAIAQGG